MLATDYLLAHGASTGWPALAVTVVTAALVTFTRVNPLWLFAVGAVLGVVGLI